MVELKGTWIFSWEGQGFRSSRNRSGVVDFFFWGGGGGARGFFLSWAGDLTRSYLWTFDNFPMLKTTFHKYWTSSKIKIRMIYLYREHKVKKLLNFSLVIRWKLLFSLLKGIFFLVGEMNKFLTTGRFSSSW